jgi:hypothetical protein
MPDCNTCKAKKSLPNVPYVVHEGVMFRLERVIKRLWIALVMTIILLVGTNIFWIAYESQFEDSVTITQENDDGYNNYVGNDCDIING